MKEIILDIKEEQRYLDSFGTCIKIFDKWPLTNKEELDMNECNNKYKNIKNKNCKDYYEK